MHDGREGIHVLAAQHDVHPHQLGGQVAVGVVIQAGVALRAALQRIEEVDDHLGQRQPVDEFNPFG